MWRVYFGGSFNPIHNGHLAILSHIYDTLNNLNINFVLSVLPVAQNPFKSAVLSAEHRLCMLDLALNHTPIQIDTTEIYAPTPTYTIDTLTILQQKYLNDRLIFVIGQDSLYGLPTWKNYTAILSLANLWVLPRCELDDTKQIFLPIKDKRILLTKNSQNHTTASHLPLFLSQKITANLDDILQKSTQIYLDNKKVLQISSRQIRQMLYRTPKDTLLQYLPSDVLNYIYKHSIYKHNIYKCDTYR